jgi:hypothetical protein
MRLFTQIPELSLPILVCHHALVKNLGSHNNGMNAIYFHNHHPKWVNLMPFGAINAGFIVEALFPP